MDTSTGSKMGKKLTVAALMPCLNEEQSVDRSLGALFNGSRWPDEIIVADGGSTDGTMAKISAWRERGLPIKVVNNVKVLPGAGRNAAAAASKCDVLIGIDFGNGYNDRYVERMTAPFEDDPDIGHVIGRFQPVITSPFENAVAVLDYTVNLVASSLSRQEILAHVPKDGKATAGMVVAWRRSSFERAGGQPDWLRAAEDVLFGQKLIEQGIKIHFEPDAIAEHHMRSTLGEFFRMRTTYAIGRARAGLPKGKMAREGGFFLASLLAIVATLVTVMAIPLALFLFAAYVGRNVLRPWWRAKKRLPNVGEFGRSILIAVARDAAIITGLTKGSVDWTLDPKWRRRRESYMAGVASGREAR